MAEALGGFLRSTSTSTVRAVAALWMALIKGQVGHMRQDGNPPREVQQAVCQALKLRRYVYYEQARFPRPEIGITSKMREVEIFTVA